TLPGLRFENVQQSHLGDVWHYSSGFNQFRGEGWLPDPCRTCDRRHIDFGGCRCQAFHVTGNAGITDPACSLSSHHKRIEAARSQATQLAGRSEEHTSELQSRVELVCRLLLEKKN